MKLPVIYISTTKLRGLTSGKDWPGITTQAIPGSAQYEPSVPRCKTCVDWGYKSSFDETWDLNRKCLRGVTNCPKDGSGHCHNHSNV